MPNAESLHPSDLNSVLPLLLATPGSGQLADQASIWGFLDYLEHGQVRWEGVRCGDVSSPTALFLTLLLPGSTAIILVPTPGEHGIDAAEQKALTIASLAQLHGRQLHFAQVLLLPDAEGQRRLLEQVGFRRLAPLLYLERDARYPWVDPPEADESAWVEFRPETRDAFAATLLATYEESLDCPELANLRPIDDILAGHRAAGRFNPRFWELLRVDGQNAACLLLNALSPARTLELVYMGVRTEFRQRGIGSLLLQRALQRCRDSGARRLTVAVDDRNDPAKRLYARFALRSIARREVYLYRWATGGEQAAKPADDRAHEGPETGDCASVG